LEVKALTDKKLKKPDRVKPDRKASDNLKLRKLSSNLKLDWRGTAIRNLIRSEVGNLIDREVRKLVRDVLEEKIQDMINIEIWGSIEKARMWHLRKEQEEILRQAREKNEVAPRVELKGKI
jgi:hypothetical protein